MEMRVGRNIVIEFFRATAVRGGITIFASVKFGVYVSFSMALVWLRYKESVDAVALSWREVRCWTSRVR